MTPVAERGFNGWPLDWACARFSHGLATGVGFAMEVVSKRYDSGDPVSRGVYDAAGVLRCGAWRWRYAHGACVPGVTPLIELARVARSARECDPTASIPAPA